LDGSAAAGWAPKDSVGTVDSWAGFVVKFVETARLLVWAAGGSGRAHGLEDEVVGALSGWAVGSVVEDMRGGGS
jgi:hypothetical protein